MKKTFSAILFFALCFCCSFAIAQPVASVVISQTTGTDTICAGSQVAFTAAPTNGGTSPIYHWYVNGSLVSATTAVYSTTTLPTGSPYVYCIMTSNLSGVTGSPATSDTIQLRVYPRPGGSISGTATICAGDTAILTLHLTGTSPFSGKLSDSTMFYGLSDTIHIPVSPAGNTTYQIATLSDTSLCNASGLTSSAIVTVKTRPTARDSGTATICAGTSTPIIIHVTGTAPFHGTLNNGATFSSSSTTITVPVTPSADTTYTIATLSDANCPAIASGLTDSVAITVIPRPQAMMMDSDTICNGQYAFLYIGLSNGAPWQVVYSNGSHLDTITAYFSPWTFYVTPTTTTNYHITSVTANGCAARPADITGAGLVVVNSKPAAVITALAHSSQCFTHNTFNFNGSHSTVSSGSIANWNWSFGTLTPDTASGSTPTVHFSDTTTNQLVTLYVTTNKGCTDSASTHITIKPSPGSAFAVSDTAICQQGMIITQALVGTDSVYTWYWGDGADSSCQCPDLIHAYNSFNDKRLKLSVTNTNGCTDTSSILIHIHPLPLVNFTISDTAQCYQGNNFAFTDHSTLPATQQYGDLASAYLWRFGDTSAVDTFMNPTYSYPENTLGIYTVVEGVKTSFGCSDSYQKQVTVYKTPEVQIINSMGTDTICAGIGYRLTAMTDAVRPAYRWSTSSSRSYIDSISATSGYLSSTISYIVTVTDSASHYCSNTALLTVTSVPNTPAPIINNGLIPMICDSSTVEFDVTNASDSNSYFWYTYPAQPISGQGSPHSDITFTTSGAAIVYVTSINIPWGCTATSHDTIYASNISGLSVSIVETPDLIDTTLIAIVTPDSDLIYQWGYNSAGLTPNIVSGATTQSYLLDSGQNSATYWVIVTDTATHCSTKAYVSAPTTTTGIKDINGTEARVAVYPNPSTEKFTLTIKSVTEQSWSIEITDISGKQIAAAQTNKEQNVSWQVNASAWAEGTYLLIVQSASGDTKVLKLIRE